MATEGDKLKLVIDCDPGSDDTVALMAAFGSGRFEVVGVTTVFGNASVDQTTDNALRILQALGETQVPVYRGASGSWSGKTWTSAEGIHGKGGLGGVHLPEAKREPEDMSAAAFIVDVCNRYPHEVCFLFCAPLTNLADAIRLDPFLPSKWRRLAIMGGVFKDNGNITIHSEFNIYSDARAANEVFRYVQDTMVLGLDVTMKCPLSSADIASIAERSRLPAIAEIYASALEFYKRERAWMSGTPPHDAIALMALLHPELFGWQKRGVEVIAEGEKEGQTKLSDGDRPKNDVAVSVDSGKILEYIKKYITKPEQLELL